MFWVIRASIQAINCISEQENAILKLNTNEIHVFSLKLMIKKSRKNRKISFHALHRV